MKKPIYKEYDRVYSKINETMTEFSRILYGILYKIEDLQVRLRALEEKQEEGEG